MTARGGLRTTIGVGQGKRAAQAGNSFEKENRMPLMDMFWAMLGFFLWIIWIWMLIALYTDIFRSDDLSGAGKAGWTLFTLLLPFLGIFVYLIARGKSMGERAARQAAEQDAAARAYIQEAAGSSTATELQTLSRLHTDGVLTDDEFKAQKAKLLVA
jgi:Phospholipase_D-nuclease N-terminal/Short C-terminal domain